MRISDWSSDVCSSDLSARTAEQFFHRLLIERGAALVEAGKKQVLLTLIGFDHQPGEGEESTLSPQQFNRMQARRVVRYVEDNLCRRGCQALSRIHDMLAQWVGEPVKKTAAFRSEERRVGKACVSTCRSRGSPEH